MSKLLELKTYRIPTEAIQAIKSFKNLFLFIIYKFPCCANVSDFKTKLIQIIEIYLLKKKKKKKKKKEKINYNYNF